MNDLHESLIAYTLEGHGKVGDTIYVDIRTRDEQAEIHLLEMVSKNGVQKVDSNEDNVVRITFEAEAIAAVTELSETSPESFSLDHENMVLNLNLGYWLGEEVFSELTQFRMFLDEMNVATMVLTISEAERILHGQAGNENKPEGVYLVMQLDNFMTEMLVPIMVQGAGGLYGTMRDPMGVEMSVAIFTPASNRTTGEGSEYLQ